MDQMRSNAWLAAAFGAVLGFSAVAAPNAADAAAPAAATAAKRTDLRAGGISAEAEHVARWVGHSGDHRGLPFAIVDKANAKLHAFNGAGTLVRTTPVLVGMGIGDALPPGTHDLDMYQLKPWQRVTPAGRFVGELERKGRNESIVWVYPDAGIAIHKMPTRKTKQRRAERMASPRPEDHRITYGCINVPAAFYDEVISPAFRRGGLIVYVLPENAPARALFKSYDVAETAPVQQSARGAF
jgi:hypothetical protein